MAGAGEMSNPKKAAAYALITMWTYGLVFALQFMAYVFYAVYESKTPGGSWLAIAIGPFIVLATVPQWLLHATFTALAAVAHHRSAERRQSIAAQAALGAALSVLFAGVTFWLHDSDTSVIGRFWPALTMQHTRGAIFLLVSLVLGTGASLRLGWSARRFFGAPANDAQGAAGAYPESGATD